MNIEEVNELVEKAAAALGLAYLTPDQRSVLVNLYEDGFYDGRAEGYDQGRTDEMECYLA